MAELDRWEEKNRSFIAESAIMKEKAAILEKIAEVDSPVLILGESGSGKKRFAEQIHLRGNRARGPFVHARCAALSEKLAQNGVPGGGTETDGEDWEGWLTKAEGGTLFLDEIADAALSFQARLARFFAERPPENEGRTGGVRIIAATGKNIEALIEDGLFRKDLYYRLNVFPVRVPPLRERNGDIVRLALFFKEQYEAAAGKQFAGFSGDALAALESYTWPGNVRELANCVERACVIADGPFIEKADLLLAPDPEPALLFDSDVTLKTALNNFKRRFIRAALERNNWNQTRTAKTLDIERTYLSRLVKELDVKRED
jgi:Nif-specific regulatory protein